MDLAKCPNCSQVKNVNALRFYDGTLYCRSCKDKITMKKRGKRKCLKCGKKFQSQNVFNRVCYSCKQGNAKIYPINEVSH